eukprot:11364724-Prorocentrum_lima.AAC.1
MALDAFFCGLPSRFWPYAVRHFCLAKRYRKDTWWDSLVFPCWEVFIKGPSSVRVPRSFQAERSQPGAS